MHKITSRCVVAPANEPGNPNPRRSRLTFTGLLDTGAEVSAISRKVVAACSLKAGDHTQDIQGVGGTILKLPVFFIRLSLKDDIEIPNLRVVQGLLDNFDVLIGMDVIGKGDFQILNNKGKTNFSFHYLPAPPNPAT